MTRYTFEELKVLQVNDTFYSDNKKFYVDSTPTYYNTSEFYGDFSEKVEWTGICVEVGDEEENRQHTFVVQSSQPEGEARDILIFKDIGEV